MLQCLAFFVATTLLASQRVLGASILKDRAVPAINSPGSFDNLNLYEQYSAAAYCKDTIDSTAILANGFSTKLRCKAHNCPLVEQADTLLLLAFDETGDHNVAGFVALDKTNKAIIVSFRGSVTLNNWLDDFKVLLVDWQCDGCKAHVGFAQSWDAVSVKIEDAIFLGNKGYGYPIVVTGHSYGAAVATLAAAELADRFYPRRVSLYNYGSPAVGNSALAQYVANQATIARVTHAHDPVPRVPPPQLGFTHVEPEYWITSGNGVTVVAGDIKVMPNGGGDMGSVDLGAKDDHTYYFNYITSCGDVK
ncbi:MAG: hypothetical protein M1839_004117 [Geoglossum umbratile]|nr:MAG: hypothetical protein M1839_004117 [Geoglossum umbratile]